MKTSPASFKKALHASVKIPVGYVELEGDLDLPPDAPGVVIFAHGSGSSRHSRRNQYVAEVIRATGVGTLLFDLLTQVEEQEDDITRGLRFDIDLLARRLIGATRWLESHPETRGLKMGYFGSSTGGAAALMAAAELGDRIAVVVSRGGRPDLAGNALHRVRSPTLLIVGGLDEAVIALNEEAFEKLGCEKSFRIVPGATHLFEEPGKLEQVAQLSAHWFSSHLGAFDDQKEAT